MSGGGSIGSGLDAVAETVGEQAIEAIKALANETRLAILIALWDAQDPSRITSEDEDMALSFSTLRERLGRPDSGQFNYHLKQLVGPFVDQSEEGYTLTTPAEQILHTILAGTLTDAPSYDGEPVDVGCYQCGAPTVVDYEDGMLTQRCTSCEGVVRGPSSPPGTLSQTYFPPAGLRNRTPPEFFRAYSTWDHHRWMSLVKGVCPDCSGSRTATLHVCEAHDTADGGVCENCGQIWDPQWAFVCDVCKLDMHVPGFPPIFADSGVRGFLYEHGRDHTALAEAGAFAELIDSIEAVDVIAGDPVKLRVTVELDGDRLTVTLDDDAHVTGVSMSKN
jgi:hypothetical protein